MLRETVLVPEVSWEEVPNEGRGGVRTNPERGAGWFLIICEERGWGSRR